jgi:hypothetical protein
MWDPAAFLYVSDGRLTKSFVFIRTARERRSHCTWATQTEIPSTDTTA